MGELIIISIIIIYVLYKITNLPRELDREKQSIYECGNITSKIRNEKDNKNVLGIRPQNPYGEETKWDKENNNIKYFKVGIIFLIFDLETIWLFPIYNLSNNNNNISNSLYPIIIIFMIILIIGIIYELNKGLLNKL